MSRMNPWAKVGVVIAGYVGACLAAAGAVYVNELLMPADVSQASSGMAAFGDMVLFLGSLGFCAFFPTGLALYFVALWFLSRSKDPQS